MKKVKEILKQKGWHFLPCSWQVNPVKGVIDFTLESYVIRKDEEVRIIIIQHWKDGSSTLFANDSDLLKG